MKIILILLVSILFAPCFQGCRNPNPEPETGETLQVINIENIDESIDIRLSELADNFRIIPLETTSEAIIGTKSFYVSDDYIIAFNQDGCYKFSSEGKFIRKIANLGHGPYEISKFVSYSVNEKLKLLAINDLQRQNDIYIYDMVSEKFLDPVIKHYPGFWPLFLCDDSLIIGAYNSSFQKDSEMAEPYAVFYQDLSGNIFTGLPHTKKYSLTEDKNESFRYVIISFDGNHYHARFRNEDTLYIVRKEELIPYLALTYEKQQDNGIRHVGDWSYSFSEYESPDYTSIRKSVITEYTPVSAEAVRIQTEMTHFLFDKSSRRTYKINSITDDFKGQEMDLGRRLILFPHILLPNGTMILTYYPYEVQDIISRGNKNVNLSPELWDQLIDISKTLKENDNPVLLVGDAKGLPNRLSLKQ